MMAVEALDIEVTTSWDKYIWSLLNIANQVTYTGISSSPDVPSVLYFFRSIVANTSYTAHAWLDNYSGQDKASKNCQVYSAAAQLSLLQPWAALFQLQIKLRIKLVSWLVRYLWIKQGQLTALTSGTRRNLASSLSFLLSAAPISDAAPLAIDNSAQMMRSKQ